MPIRPYHPSDLAILHAANEASVPGVSTETETDLARWINLATCFVATGDDDAPLGFITLIEPGTRDYPSDNLRWFEAYCDRTGKSLIYVDRIALLPAARGHERLGRPANHLRGPLRPARGRSGPRLRPRVSGGRARACT
ncbi:MAG: hypothetical protein VXW22_16215, partial [Pseudomonadota bacterium]|nr:hypothetical protein [Pseudomonadota bacterium]